MRRTLVYLAVCALAAREIREARGDWCLRCGQPGHTSSSCPRPFPPPPAVLPRRESVFT